jgi:membrane protease YdiL (CAAX protease family)
MKEITMVSQSQKSPIGEVVITKADPAKMTTLLIIILLAVRILYGGLAALALPYSPLFLGLLNYLYPIATYLVTALLIWRERRRLSEYRIGQVAVVLFIAGVPFYALVGLLKIIPLPPFPNLFLLPISIWLAVKLFNDKQVEWANPAGLARWLLAGMGLGIAFGSLVGLLIALQPEHLMNTSLILNIILQPAIQISTAAIFEEPLFRGFLWVYLYQRGWKNRWIWLFQAFLFGIVHIYYLPARDYYSLGTCFILGLVFGWVAWKARDTAPSMVTHGFCNAFAQLIGDLAASR